jgi:hypothetical protein
LKKYENSKMDLTISNDEGDFFGHLLPCDAFEFKA